MDQLFVDDFMSVSVASADRWSFMPVRSSLRIPQPISWAPQGSYFFTFVFQNRRYCRKYSFLMLELIVCRYEGDVSPEEIVFLSCLLFGETAWRFLLPHWGTQSFLTSETSIHCWLARMLICLVCFLCAITVDRRMLMMTATSQTTATRLTGGEMHWLNPASCS